MRLPVEKCSSLLEFVFFSDCNLTNWKYSVDINRAEELLVRALIFSALSPFALGGMIPDLPWRKLAQNEYLYRDGGPGVSLSVVLGGELSVELEQK